MKKDAAVTVRIPDELKQLLAGRAEREHRSLSAQVQFELERAVAEERPRATRPALGMFDGSRLPTDADFRNVRASLWGNLSRRRA